MFTARVVAIERGGHATERVVQVRITERWRGHGPGTGGRIAVFTRSSALCGYPFKEGREYLIYGWRNEDGRLTTSICSRTTPLERAADDLSYARNAATGIVPAGRLVGDVRLKTRGHRSRGVPNVSVTVANAGGATSTMTDGAGRYSLELPSAGRYDLLVKLPDTHYPIQPHQVIDVPDPRACVERSIDVSFNGGISGRIIDSTGRGVAGLPVAHVALGESSRGDERTSVLTRDDGSFEIGRLSPGRFEIQIELPDEGADWQADETLVGRGVLGEGERQTVETFTVGSTMPIVRLQGMVVGADGWSLADARVFLKGESGERLLGVPAITDALGRFVLAAVEGERYQVFAERPSGETEFSDPVSITAQRAMAPLRLVVRRRF